MYLFFKIGSTDFTFIIPCIALLYFTLKMSSGFNLRAWLNSTTQSTSKEVIHPLLPNADDELSPEDALMVCSGNKEVKKALQLQPKPKLVRTSYFHYDGEIRLKIGKFAAENGNKKAVEKFTQELKINVNESTVRSMKLRYLNELKKGKEPIEIVTLPHNSRGRPLKLGELDVKVRRYIEQLRLKGTPINRTIVVAAATGIVQAFNPTLLNSGEVQISGRWAASIMYRMGLSKRKGTKASRTQVDNFEEIKAAFLHRIAENIIVNNIPDTLIINWDQTGSKLVPVSNWTMAVKGSKQVEVISLDDKREITVLMSCAMSGTLLPPQVLYTGKTPRCHPNVQFPTNWDVYHTANHWSNEESMCRFIDNIIVPYVTSLREQIAKPEQIALVICDVYAPHRCQSILEKLNQHKIHIVYIPAGCTGSLQPLDVSVNEEFKRAMKGYFNEWYANVITEQLNKGEDLDTINVNIKTSNVKPMHAKWLISVITKLQTQPETIIRGFRQAGIINCVER